MVAIYRKTYAAMNSSRNRDVDIVAHFLPHFGARPLDEITKLDIGRYVNFSSIHARHQLAG